MSYLNEYNSIRVAVIPDSVTYNGTTYSVTSIGYNAFYRCTGLTSVTIPESVTTIGYGAFYECSGLTSVTIGSSVTSIGNYAFFDCSGLISVTIPNSVTNIGKKAFKYCSGLTSVTIPGSVTSIGKYAFADCSGLESIIVKTGNTIYDSREDCNAIIETYSNTLIAGCKNTVIPESVTSIGVSAFRGCSGLTSVTIGSSVTSIGDFAFEGCSGLTDVYCFAKDIPSVSGNQFVGVNTSDATRHVPSVSLETYKTTAPWRSFGTIVALTDEELTGVLPIDNGQWTMRLAQCMICRVVASRNPQRAYMYVTVKR